MQTATPPYCDSKAPVIPVTGSRSGVKGFVVNTTGIGDLTDLYFVLSDRWGSGIQFGIMIYNVEGQNDCYYRQKANVRYGSLLFTSINTFPYSRF